MTADARRTYTHIDSPTTPPVTSQAKHYVIRIEGLADGRPFSGRGQYVSEYHVNAKRGRGDLVLTRNPANAMRFRTKDAAFDCWQKQCDPPYANRRDGKPNRPMTAYTVTILPYP
jgi:hypothetical protein